MTDSSSFDTANSKKALRVLDLFSGIGGFSLGLERTGGFRTIGFCEIDAYCRAVITKHWPGVAIHDDIATHPADASHGIDVICGGFPCQPFSVAGKRRGATDDRWLWPEMEQVIRRVRPGWVVCENVPGIIGMELDKVIDDLEGQGYSCWTFSFPWDRDWQSALRELRGVDDGLSYGVERVDTLRNAIVPQIAEAIGHAILKAESAR